MQINPMHKGTKPRPPARYGWNVHIVLDFSDASQVNH